MNYLLHCTPDENEEKQILDGLWKHNDHFAPVDIQPLRITVKDESDNIKGEDNGQNMVGRIRHSIPLGCG